MVGVRPANEPTWSLSERNSVAVGRSTRDGGAVNVAAR